MNKYAHQRGEIKDNALKALIHDPLFHQRIEKSKKGKGSYQRKAKHSKQEAGNKFIDTVNLFPAFFKAYN